MSSSGSSLEQFTWLMSVLWLGLALLSAVVAVPTHGRDNNAVTSVQRVEPREAANPCEGILVGQTGPYLCLSFVVVGIVELELQEPLEELLDVPLAPLTMLAVGLNPNSGPLPSAIGQCTNLEVLYMTDGTHDQLPPQLGTLCQLRALYLSDFTEVGTMPDLQCLTELVYLRLSYLRGTQSDLPQPWNPNMVDVECYDSGFTGTLSREIGAMTSLESFSVSGNKLGGTIPPQVGLLVALETLDLEFNSFGGPLPPEIGGATQLTAIWAQSNRLDGTLPSEINRLGRMQKLNLPENRFTGEIPNLDGLSLLDELDLSFNALEGTIPTTIGCLTNLQRLFLNSNQLEGILPPTMVALTRLSVLEIDTNRLSGTLDLFVSALVSITFVTTSRNRFRGRVPGELWTVDCLDSGLLNQECVVPCDCGAGKLLWHEGDAHGDNCGCVHVWVLCIAPAFLLFLFAFVLLQSKRARRRRTGATAAEGVVAESNPDTSSTPSSSPIFWSIVKMLMLGTGVAFDVLLLEVGVVQLNQHLVFLLLWVGTSLIETFLGICILMAFNKNLKSASASAAMWWSEWTFALLSPRVMAVLMRGVVKRELGRNDALLVDFQLCVSRYKLVFNAVALAIQVVIAARRGSDALSGPLVLALGMSVVAVLISTVMCVAYLNKRECISEGTWRINAAAGSGLRAAYVGPKAEANR